MTWRIEKGKVPAMRRVFYDTEFIENGRTIDLISIGLVDEDGDKLYLVNQQMPTQAIFQHEWLMQNVVPALPLLGRRINTDVDPTYPYGVFAIDTEPNFVQPLDAISQMVKAWLLMKAETHGPIELWADYCAYDHVRLAQLWGPMSVLPEGIPMYTNDLRTFASMLTVSDRELPPHTGRQHHALDDAIQDMRVFEYLMKDAWEQDLSLPCLRVGECEEHEKLHAHPGWYTDLEGDRVWVSADAIVTEEKPENASATVDE